MAEDGPAQRSRVRPDLATLLGLALALGGILGGLVLEHGKLQDVMAPTALLIVLGGTAGAVLVATPMRSVIRAGRGLFHVLTDRSQPSDALMEQIVEFATRARKNGVVSLEEEAAGLPDPFLRKALTLAVDGVDLQELRRMMELEIDVEEHDVDEQARVFESAGGYAPTIGIIGAVIGLIQVMKDLADIDRVGQGIATAFVATIYGVGFANVIFLPAAAKIKARARERLRTQELILEGVSSIVEGLNPKMIRNKLEAYCHTAAVAKPEPPAEGS